MPSSFVHALVPLSCAVGSQKLLPRLNRSETIKFALLAVVLGNACDLDLIPAFLMPSIWRDIHRNYGHNLIAITLWITAGSWALRQGVSLKFSRRAALITASLLVFSHVFLDACGDNTVVAPQYGVPLFFPFSRWEFTLPFPLFHSFALTEGVHPLVGHLTSVSFWKHAFARELGSSLGIVAGWMVLTYLGSAFQSLRHHCFRRWRSNTKFFCPRAKSNAASNSSGS